MPTPFAKQLADIAQAQFDLFHRLREGNLELFKAIKHLSAKL